MLKSIVIALLLLSAVVVLLGLFNPPRVCAATRLTDDLNDLIQMAASVVDGEIVSQSAGPGMGSIPTTLYTLRIAATHKGELAEGSEITVESFGGSNGRETMVCFGEPKLKPGDRVVLLMMKRGRNWRVLGGDVGMINLDGRGCDTQASRANGTFQFYVNDKTSLTGYRLINTKIVAYDLLRRLIRTVVATNRPVLEELPIPPPPTVHVDNAAIPAISGHDLSDKWKIWLGSGFVGVCLLLVLWRVSVVKGLKRDKLRPVA